MIKERDNDGKIKASAGRPKGAKNRTTEDIRQKFQMLLDNNLDSIQADLNKLKPDKRLDVLLNLANYIIPKLKATEMEVTTTNKNQFRPIIIYEGNEEN